MSVVDLDGYRWQKKAAFLQREARVNIGNEAEFKRFIEAVFRMAFLAEIYVQILDKNA